LNRDFRYGPIAVPVTRSTEPPRPVGELVLATDASLGSPPAARSIPNTNVLRNGRGALRSRQRQAKHSTTRSPGRPMGYSSSVRVRPGAARATALGGARWVVAGGRENNGGLGRD